MTIDALKAKGIADEIPARGIDSVTVPGAVAGWDALRRRFGKLSMAEDVAPAAALAEKGIAVTETDAENWRDIWTGRSRIALASQACLLAGWEGAGGGADCSAIRSLAATLRRIGEHGRDGFYKGATAEAMLKLSDELHGFLQADDLTDFQPEWVDPVSTTYHGWTVWEMPPNGQGIAALSMLNIMERFPIAQWGHNSQKALHVEIEAKKLAYADLAALHRRSARFAYSGGATHLEAACREAGGADYGSRAVQCVAVGSERAAFAAVERHDVSGGGRP